MPAFTTQPYQEIKMKIINLPCLLSFRAFPIYLITACVILVVDIYVIHYHPLGAHLVPRYNSDFVGFEIPLRYKIGAIVFILLNALLELSGWWLVQ